MLEKASSERSELRNEHPAIFYLTGRFYYGAYAYYDFCTKGYGSVLESLDRAGHGVRMALSLERFLIPAATISADIPLKKARIARDLGNWVEMRKHLDTVRNMIMDREPLCTLEDGTPIFHSTIREMVPEDLGTSETVRYLTNPAVRLREYRYVVEGLYQLPDLLITHP